jgi:type II secretory pathway component PulC
MKRLTHIFGAVLLAIAGGTAMAEDSTALNPLAAIQLDSLAATREQPLFSRDRKVYRPVQAVPAPKVVMPPVPNLSLVGVVLSDTSPLVILIDQTLKTQVRMREGETYNGWTLKRVEPLQAIIQNGATEFRLLLPTAKGS